MRTESESFEELVERDPLEVYRRHKEIKLWWQRQQQEIELARRRAEQEMELGRLERLSKLSLEVLVLAARTPEQARIFERLARLETMKGLSKETIISLAAAEDPRLAEALSPVLLKMFQAGAADDYRQLVERLIAMQKEGADRTREDYQASLRAFAQMFERFADTTKEVARAAAGAGAGRTCPNGHPAPPEARFCMECGLPVS